MICLDFYCLIIVLKGYVFRLSKSQSLELR